MGLFRYSWKSAIREGILIVGAIFFSIPLYILLTFSVKNQSDAFQHPLSFPKNPTLSNYSTALKGAQGLSLGHAMVNSLIITIGSLILLLAFGSVGAYTIARRTGRMSTGVYFLFLCGFILPYQLAIVPLFVAMRSLHLLGSYVGMILFYTGLLMPLTVFLYAGFIRVLPTEYEESAQVDGASLMRTYLRVVFPLLRPVTATVAILAGIIIWNDFFAPLIFLGGTKHETLTVVVYTFVGDYTSQWAVIFAAVTVAIAPVMAFYIFSQRHLIRGFSGGIRG
jgi:raffinose/stachyose/melibiose transport system permease protein